MKLPNPWWLLVFVLLLGAAGAGGFWYGGEVREDALTAQQSREQKLVDQVQTAVVQAVAKGVSQIKVNNTTIRQEVEREVHTNTVYADCRHPPEQLQRINAAIAGRRPQGAAGGVVPGADTSPGPELRRHDAEAPRSGGNPQ